MPTLILAPSHMIHILTVMLQPRPTALCPATDSSPSIFNPSVRGAGQRVVHTGGTANQGLGEGLGILQHGVRWQGSNWSSGAVTWKSRASWHCFPGLPAATQSQGVGRRPYESSLSDLQREDYIAF